MDGNAAQRVLDRLKASEAEEEKRKVAEATLRVIDMYRQYACAAAQNPEIVKVASGAGISLAQACHAYAQEAIELENKLFEEVQKQMAGKP